MAIDTLHNVQDQTHHELSQERIMNTVNMFPGTSSRTESCNDIPNNYVKGN